MYCYIFKNEYMKYILFTKGKIVGTDGKQFGKCGPIIKLCKLRSNDKIVLLISILTILFNFVCKVIPNLLDINIE